MTILLFLEFYAATEGNASVLNTKNKAGAVGYIPPLIMKLYPLELVRLEDDNETPKRDKNGLCILCKPGEKGELLGKIDNSDPTRKFDGYLNKKATEKKILRDGLKKNNNLVRPVMSSILSIGISIPIRRLTKENLSLDASRYLVASRK